MSRQLFIGLAVEGNTDRRFLKSVVLRTFKRILFDECDQDVDVEVFPLNTSKIGRGFREFVAAASHDGVHSYGILVLAVHADSDKETLDERMEDKFIPAQEFLESLSDDEYCKILTPVIPMKMLEAWLLADTGLLREEIGTEKSDSELGLARNPESIADPKNVIQEAIRLAHSDLPKKRRTLSINDLYDILGDEMDLESLDRLSSYRTFVSKAREALIELHYLHA